MITTDPGFCPGIVIILYRNIGSDSMSLRFITGKVKSGKTSAIIAEIKASVEQGSGRQLLLVPEQYSHEAERELCLACGDRFSLFAEVMSFSGFARWSMGVYGGGADARMDKGGKLLCMATALKELQPVLRIYGRSADNTDLQAQMVLEADRMYMSASDSGTLRSLAKETDGDLREKLNEFSLILDTYEAVTERAGASSEDPLALLAGQIEKFGLPEFDRVYVDGFIDFTGLELNVLRMMLSAGKDLTVCLPVEKADESAEYLLPSVIAMKTLRETAESLGAEVKQESVENRIRDDMLTYYADHMFDYGAAPFDANTNQIRLLQPENPRVECEAAAAEILHAVYEDGCRWRDIAVAVRGFEDYRGILESTFRRYEIPLFLTRRDSVSEKPLPLWMETAYDVLLSNWETEDVITHLRCGLSGLEEDECDALCRYLYKWQLRGNAWLSKDAWRQHPDGYGKPWSEEIENRLQRINAARHKVAEPLLKLRERSNRAQTATEQVAALSGFLQETHAAERLESRVAGLELEGKTELRGEYVQLWELCTGALEQIADVLGETRTDTSGFREILHAVLTQYDIGLIPAALDRVSAGDFDRMRRRNIKRLIVLGCSDDRLPQGRSSEGIFSAEEREILAEHRLMIGGGEAELWREYALIYHTLSLPHEKMILSCPLTGLKGELLLPAMVYSQAKRIFGLRTESVQKKKLRLYAARPALTLAVAAGCPGAGQEEAAAREWFLKQDPERIESLLSSSHVLRRDLSTRAVEALYGRRIRISPSRMERFSACRFAYYCNYGLKAEEDVPASFRAPEIGTFVHAVLEQTAREVSALGGFRAVSDEKLREITRTAVSDYIHIELTDFKEKTARFRHLFERICQDVYRIVADTAEELRHSDFVPLSFELDVSRLPGSDSTLREELQLTGITDRVDGWIHDDSLWLRVVDYKTGRKKFSLSDIWYGRNMQMLLYLFAVCDSAEMLYGKPGVPAGVLYLPAREELLQFDRKPDEEETLRQRMKGKRRSGLLLDDPELIEAWEQGTEKQYIPVRVLSANPLVTLEQMGLLRRHVEESLRQMAEEIRAGSIAANPSYVSESDNACRTCQFHSICRFEEGENGDFRCPTPKLSDETVWSRLMEEGT